MIELYKEGKIVEAKASYTGYMLEMLHASPVALATRERRYKTVGDRNGVPQGIINANMQRLGHWVKLCINVVNAEYPFFVRVASVVLSAQPQQFYAKSINTANVGYRWEPCPND